MSPFTKNVLESFNENSAKEIQFQKHKGIKYSPCQVRLRSESDENGWFTLQNPTSGLFLTGWPGLAYPTVEGEIFIFECDFVKTFALL